MKLIYFKLIIKFKFLKNIRKNNFFKKTTLFYLLFFFDGLANKK